MKSFIVILFAICFIAIAHADPKQVFLNTYKNNKCGKEPKTHELVYTLSECKKYTKYLLDGSKVKECSYKDSGCAEASVKQCKEILTLNVCEEKPKSTSSKYVLGPEEGNSFFMAFLAVFGAAGYLYKKIFKKSETPTPSPPTPTPVATSPSTPAFKPSTAADPNTRAVEDQLNVILAKLKVTGPITKVGDCKYQIGSKKVTMQVLSGYLVVRVGGGFMKFEEWIQRFGRNEGLMIAGELVNGVGIGTLSAHGSHTIKPLPQKSG